jgi:hypothetical protein
VGTCDTPNAASDGTYGTHGTDAAPKHKSRESHKSHLRPEHSALGYPGRPYTPYFRPAPLKPFPVAVSLAAVTMHDRIDRRRPVTGGYIIPHKGEFQAAAAEQSPRLKCRGKSKPTA